MIWIIGIIAVIAVAVYLFRDGEVVRPDDSGDNEAPDDEK